MLLLTSGIGGQGDLSGVGRHLQDQVMVPRAYLTPWRKNQFVSTNGIAALGHLRADGDTFHLAIGDSTGHSILPSTLAMPLRKRWEFFHVDMILENIFIVTRKLLKLLLLYNPMKYFLRHFTTTILLCLMTPTSEGSVSICPKNNTPKEGPIRRQNILVNADAGYLNDSRDIFALKSASIRLQKEEQCPEALSNAFRPFVLFGIDWFQVFASQFSLPYFHWFGTCKMRTQSNDDWVVNNHLRLRNHEGLHVCDMSVFPSAISSPPALACCALGYEFSKTLLSTKD